MIDPVVRDVDVSNEFDRPQLDLLEAEARAELVDQRGGPQWLAENPQLSPTWELATVEYGGGRRYSKPITLAAVIDEVVVGALVADIDLAAPAPVVRVTFVWVTPEARELGFGDALVERVIEIGKAHGAQAIEGQALPGDRQTKNLWERAGIVARLITTSRRFG